jgi:hypothetical protein
VFSRFLTDLYLFGPATDSSPLTSGVISSHVRTRRGIVTRPAKLARIIREVISNPFTQFRSEWRTGTVTDLARTISESNRFDRMPILADTLEEAGCEDARILTHCRGPNGHVPGCWVVDEVMDQRSGQ